MTVINIVAQLPDGSVPDSPTSRAVTITCISGSRRPAHVSSGEVVSRQVVYLDASGEVSPDLIPTEGMVPEGCHYLVECLGHEWRILVPASGGPYDVGDPDIAAAHLAPATLVPGPVGPMQVILGTVPTVGDLPGSPDHGDAWVVEADGRLRVWSDITSAWASVPYRGVQGVPGPAGAVGVPGLNGGIAYRPSGLDGWFSRLATASASPGVDVVVIGDSIAAQGTTVEPAWPWLLGRALAERARLSVTDQMVYAGGAGSVPTVTTTGGSTSTAGLGGWSRTIGAAQSLSHVATCDGVSVVYSGGGGTLTVREGGAEGTILGTINTGSVSGRSHIWTSGALPRAERGIWIGTSASTTVEALYLHDGTRTAGVRVWPAVHHGWTSGDFGPANTGRALDLIDRLDDAGTLGLVIVATATNDSTPGGADYQQLLDAVAARTAAPVVGWVPYVSNQVAAGEVPGLVATLTGRGIPHVRQDVLTPRFREEHTADGTHPFPTSQQLLADHMWALVGGDPIGQALADVPRIGTASTQAAPGDVLTRPRTRTAVLVEDFLVPGGAPAWAVETNAGGTQVRGAALAAHHPGWERVNVTTTTDSRACLSLTAVGDVGSWRQTWIVRRNTGGGGPRTLIGPLTVVPGGAPFHGAAVEYDPVDGWAWVDYAVGSRTATPFTSPPGAWPTSGAWLTIDIIALSATTRWVLVDGALAHTQTVTSAAMPAMTALAIGGTGRSGYLDIDLAQFAQTALNR